MVVNCACKKYVIDCSPEIHIYHYYIYDWFIWISNQKNTFTVEEGKTYTIPAGRWEGAELGNKT